MLESNKSEIQKDATPNGHWAMGTTVGGGMHHNCQNFIQSPCIPRCHNPSEGGKVKQNDQRQKENGKKKKAGQGKFGINFKRRDKDQREMKWTPPPPPPPTWWIQKQGFFIYTRLLRIWFLRLRY